MGVIRLLLAVAVMLAHAPNPDGLGPFIKGGAAVQLFFIISGFYMALVLSEGYSDTKAFYRNRLLRIYPTYLFIAAMLTLGAFVRGDPTFIERIMESPALQWDGKLLMFMANITLFGSDIMMFLFPGPEGLEFTANYHAEAHKLFPYHVLTQAWTLPVELTFYAMAPFLVRSKRRLAALLLASLGLRFWISSLGLTGDPWAGRFLPTELAFFCGGALSYHGYRLLQKVPYAGAVGMLLLGFTVIAIAQGGRLGGGFYNVWPVFIFALLAMPFIFAATKTSTIDRWIGELSFPFYLTHMIGLSMAGENLLLAAAITAGLSAAIHLLVQAPIEKKFKRYGPRAARLPEPKAAQWEPEPQLSRGLADVARHQAPEGRVAAAR